MSTMDRRFHEITGSNSSRRATNASTSALARSSHWTSSTTNNTGARVAASLTRLSVPNAMRNRSAAAASALPNATDTAPRCGPGNIST
jgi:hypothetical protein